MKKILIVFYLLLIFTETTFANNIAFINLDTIMNTSNAGTDIKKKLQISQSKLNNLLNNEQKKLKEKEVNLIEKKNILSDDEFKKELSILKKEFNNFNSMRTKKIANFEKLKQDYNIKLLSLVQPILTSYAKEKNISVLLQKKNIILGSNKLNITADILLIVNKEIKNINIK